MKKSSVDDAIRTIVREELNARFGSVPNSSPAKKAWTTRRRRAAAAKAVSTKAKAKG